MCPLVDYVVIGESYNKKAENKLFILHVFAIVFILFFLKLKSNIFYDSRMCMHNKKSTDFVTVSGRSSIKLIKCMRMTKEI